MRLRYAEAGDLPECVDIGREFWEQTPYAKQMEYSPESVDNLMGVLVENDLMIVAEYEDEIVGAAACLVTPFHFDPSFNVATEIFWYVRPGVREHGVGAAMLSNLEAIARSKGAKMFTMGNMQSTNPEASEKLFTKNGYRLTEKSFTKAL